MVFLSKPFPTHNNNTWTPLLLCFSGERLSQSMTCDGAKSTRWMIHVAVMKRTFYPPPPPPLMETRMNWMCHISRGREINIMPDFFSSPPRLVTSPRKSNCFTAPSPLQDMRYFNLNLQGPKVIYFPSERFGRTEFWGNDNKFTAGVKESQYILSVLAASVLFCSRSRRISRTLRSIQGLKVWN